MNESAALRDAELEARRGAPACGEQARYAQWLAWTSHAGLALMLLAFAAYLGGALPAFVPRHRLPEIWSHPAARYRAETGMPQGWGWVRLLGHADMLALAGVALLAASTGIGLAALLPRCARRGDRALVAVCCAEILVLLLAASGWITHR
ncbi:MAG: hypothetical protein KGL18_03485 [Burkholderiales bacterium]|nr:hypothetical protein [Burkholderiales bacterium]MDE2157325.1 hypothetical protein [Burkholderiales bacterium]MDE2502029.1 hypothetical protein [Burkholderiales bacterium]